MEAFHLHDRLILDSDAALGDVQNVLEELRMLRSEKAFAQVLGSAFAQRFKEKELSVRKHLADAFSVVVLGDFKRGKSTLINALLGDAVVPTAVTPETLTINRISYADTPRIEAVLQNGKRVLLTSEELTRDTLETILKQLPDKIAYVDIQHNAQVLREITIVDTPGLGEINHAFDAQVSEFLVNADAVLYVVSARAPLSMSEQAFLSTSVLPESFSRTFVIANMADILETKENVEKIRALTTERVAAISENCSVFLVSALNEYCRTKGLRRPNPELADVLDDNFLAFETALRDDIILQKDVIRSTRSIALVNAMLDDILSRIRLLDDSLKQGAEKLSEMEEEYRRHQDRLSSNIDKHKDSLSGAIMQMRQEASRWMTDFLSRVKAQVKSAGSSAEVADLERYMQFYLTDTIKAALLLCVQRHQTEIVDLLSVTAQSMANEVYAEAFGNINTQIAATIADISWTKVDTAMFAGNMVVSLSGLSSVIGPLYLIGQTIAGFVRQRVVSKKQEDFITPVLQQYETLVNEVLINVDAIYQQLSRNAGQKLDELYQRQREAASEAVQQAHKLALSEDIKTEEAVSYFQTLSDGVAGCKAVLGKYA